MEINYVDQYIQRKKGVAGVTGGSAAGVRTAAPQSVGPLTGQHQVAAQGFVDRTDALHLQLATFEDKMLNITKLVKLSQTLSEEKENDLRKENHELKVRLRKQEQYSSKLTSQVQDLQEKMHTMLNQGLQATQNQFKTEILATNKALEDQARFMEEKNGELQSQLISQIMTQTDQMMSNRLGDLKEDSIDRLKSAAADHCSALEAVSKRFDLLEKQTLEQYKTLTEDRLTSVTSAMKDAIMSEVRTCVRELNDEVHEDFHKMRHSFSAVEGRVDSLERELAEFIQSYRESVQIQTAKMDETNVGIKDLVDLQDKTRAVVSGELERTKEWATRNMHRLKKHIDTLNADIGALKESHVEMSGSMERLKRHHTDERDKLSALLTAKTKEANALTSMVDREIAGIHQITKHAVTSSASNTAAAEEATYQQRITTTTTGAGGACAPHRSPPHPAPLESLGFPRSAPPPPPPETSMFDDLSFTRQRNSRHQSPASRPL